MNYILRIFDGDSQSVRVHEITTPNIKIGRAASSDVVLDSPYVSREHALVRRDGNRFLLESVGRNVTQVSGADVGSSRAAEVQPNDEIKIAHFSMYIEAPAAGDEGDLDVQHALARIELDLHHQLLERVDLSQGSADGGGSSLDHRIRQVLDELVRARVPSENTEGMSAEVFEFALRESLYAEVILEVLRRSAGAEQSERAQGFMAKLDTILSSIVAELCTSLQIAGTKESLRADARNVQRNFGTVFDAWVREADGKLRTLCVQRYLTREILNLVLGFGPLQDLLEMPNTSEIMVVHKDLIYIERDGELERLHRSFITNEILISIIQRIVDPLGRRIDRSTPLVDARLPDGSRVNAVIPPLAIKGPCLTIRKFSKDPLQVADLVRFGSLTPKAADFLDACVSSHRNILISGGTGSGKTTLLNILSGFIGEGERIVTIEDSAELQLRQPHVVTLETRPPNVEGKGAYTIRDLVRNALRMRPDRVVVGECRGGEALDMLQAMNTGHDGSLTTLHANTPQDALLRLETMVLEAANLPIRAIRDQIEAAVHVIVQTQRLPSGKRMVTHISEIVGSDLETGSILTNDIFEEEDGELFFTGYLPSFIDDLVRKGHVQLDTLFAAEEKATVA
ncbi:MAG: Flp pilus assembly complex ATPase component [bacterium]|nr:Flp pilus assembly complex ATPase component [bacterium]